MVRRTKALRLTVASIFFAQAALAAPTSSPSPYVTPTAFPTAQPTSSPVPTPEEELTGSSDARLSVPAGNRVNFRELKNLARSGFGGTGLRVTDDLSFYSKAPQEMKLVDSSEATKELALTRSRELLRKYRDRYRGTNNQIVRSIMGRRIAELRKVIRTAQGDGAFTAVAARVKRPKALPATKAANIVIGTVTVLAKELTYGELGPEVPVKLYCTEIAPGGTEEDARIVQLFDGFPAVVGETQEVVLGEEGSTVTFGAEMAFPSFDDPRLHRVVESDHGNNALLLVNGDNLADLLAAKGAQPAYGTQASVESLLVDHLDSSGNVILGEGQTLVLYELGTMDPASKAFDFQDVILLLQTETVVQQDEIITLVNRIDPNGDEGTSSTDGNGGTAIWDGGDWRRAGTTIYNVPETGILEKARIVVYGGKLDATLGYYIPVTLADFNSNSYTLEIYEGSIDSLENTFWDNAVNYQNSYAPEPIPDTRYDNIPMPEVKEFGVSGVQIEGNVFPNYLLTFDLSGLGVQLLKGREYILVIHHGSSVMLARLLDSLIEDPIGTSDVAQDFVTPPLFFSDSVDSVEPQMATHFITRIK